MDQNACIQKIEELSMNALPSLQTVLFDGWILRFSNGYAKRANSINPIYFSIVKIEKKLNRVEQIYRKENLDVVFKLTSYVHPVDLDKTLSDKGYTFAGLTSVQLLSLDDINVSRSANSIISRRLSDDWYTKCCLLNNVKEQDQPTLRTILENILADVCFVRLVSENQETLACGMAVLEDQYLGLFDIVTNPEFRNKGHGQQLMLTLLQWGKDNGADQAYLQVISDNTPARNLYAKLGFKETYKYWYRIKNHR
ncbi:GNAT family N-acetyltransferase [Gracilibacillus caseinilyticus]|uniref:GNAT family N-acetyltransferase n=1 Tax=Gracilibacillus caseinilyticus TaxID=2932256 RepID=A0ABY4EY62_9BACI|nr:GNAT family N-acetyltransferase [Gracilibacillus caseinilyticus]UOQ48569.1 GNAT family N-acetyltransferase [Gracilibacillus caseinilyticus]